MAGTFLLRENRPEDCPLPGCGKQTGEFGSADTTPTAPELGGKEIENEYPPDDLYTLPLSYCLIEQGLNDPSPNLQSSEELAKLLECSRELI